MSTQPKAALSSAQSKQDASSIYERSEQPTAAPLTKEQALDLYSASRQYTNNGLRRKWDDFYKIYIGQRVSRNYEGVSDPIIREPHTIIETLVANVFGGNTNFGYRPTYEEQRVETEILTSLAETVSAMERLPLKIQEWGREAFTYGTGILHVGFRDGWPVVTNIPLRDFFIDPAATGLVKTRNPATYAGFEYFAYATDLKKEMIYDSEKDKWVKKYKNLSKIGYVASGRSGDEQNALDKEFKDMFNGSTLGDLAGSKQVHVIRIYDLNSGMEIEIGNKKEIIYQAPLWTQREEQFRTVETVDATGKTVKTKQKLDKIEPFLPFVDLRDYADPSQFYGRGEMDVIAQDAELLNDYEAMIMDNNALQNTPVGWVDPLYADMAAEFQSIPGLVLPIPRNAMGWMETPQIGADLDLKEDRIMARMRRATAADEAVQGVAQSRSRTTATEVQSQLNQAQLRFATKVQNLESGGLAQLGSIIFKIIQIFFTQTQVVRVVGPQGIDFKDFDPYEYNGEYEAYAELETTLKRKEVETGQRENQLFEIVANDPHGIFDPIEVKRWMAQKIDPNLTDDQFNKLLAKAPPPMPKAKDMLQVNYKDLEPWAKIKAQQEMGWAPDPGLEAEIQVEMTRQATQINDNLNPITDATGKVVPGMMPDMTAGNQAEGPTNGQA